MIDEIITKEGRKIIWWVKNWVVSQLFLQAHLSSGITIKIENYADWVIYNDIFVDGEYDFAIKQILNSVPSNRPLHFLDIGANVGFFTLRVADLIRRSQTPETNFEVVLVEGSPKVYENLKSRLTAESLLNNKLRMYNGLVGQRQGKGEIFESPFHVTNSIIFSGNGKKIDVPYIDLMDIYRDDSEIDLLKCDIEGSELIFIENYQQLLQRVKCAIFELHHDKCDTDKCWRLLKEAGLINHQKLRQASTFSVEFLWR